MFRSGPFRLWKKGLCGILSLTLVLGSTSGYAQGTVAPVLPEPGAMVQASAAFTPVILKGMVIHPDDPLKFDFLMDTGTGKASGEDLRTEAEKSIKYFLASLTVPEDDLWVNLSPYEKDRVIPDAFGKTVMGRDLLAEDYVLKQLASSLLYPENALGKEFWAKIYKASADQLGSAEINVDNFNRVWIMPAEAQVWEHDGKVVILKSKLKVMLESDYEAMSHQKDMAESRAPARDIAQSRHPEAQRAEGSPAQMDNQPNKVGGPSFPSGTQDDVSSPSISSSHERTKQLMRDILVPALEKEVNEGEHFARLRQVYAAMILSAWYKVRLKESLLSQAYADKNKITGIEFGDGLAKADIYDRYIASVKKGVFNYIREENDPATGETVPRKYFSGGFVGKVAPLIVAAGGILVGLLSELPAEAQTSAARAMESKGNIVLVAAGATDVGNAADPVYVAQAGTQGLKSGQAQSGGQKTSTDSAMYVDYESPDFERIYFGEVRSGQGSFVMVTPDGIGLTEDILGTLSDAGYSNGIGPVIFFDREMAEEFYRADRGQPDYDRKVAALMANGTLPIFISRRQGASRQDLESVLKVIKDKTNAGPTDARLHIAADSVSAEKEARMVIRFMKQDAHGLPEAIFSGLDTDALSREYVRRLKQEQVWFADGDMVGTVQHSIAIGALGAMGSIKRKDFPVLLDIYLAAHSAILVRDAARAMLHVAVAQSLSQKDIMMPLLREQDAINRFADVVSRYQDEAGFARLKQVLETVKAAAGKDAAMTLPELAPLNTVTGRIPMLLLTGMPSSGKSVAGEKLAQKLGIPHVSTGKILREAALKSGGAFNNEPHFVAQVEREYFRTHFAELKNGFILDYHPMTEERQGLTEAALAASGFEAASMVYIDIEQGTALDRFLRRPDRSAEAPASTASKRQAFLDRIKADFGVTDAVLSRFERAGRLATIDNNSSLANLDSGIADASVPLKSIMEEKLKNVKPAQGLDAAMGRLRALRQELGKLRRVQKSKDYVAYVFGAGRKGGHIIAVHGPYEPGRTREGEAAFDVELVQFIPEVIAGTKLINEDLRLSRTILSYHGQRNPPLGVILEAFAGLDEQYIWRNDRSGFGADDAMSADVDDGVLKETESLLRTSQATADKGAFAKRVAAFLERYNWRRAEQDDNWSRLATLFGRELFDRDPQAFMAVLKEICLHVDHRPYSPSVRMAATLAWHTLMASRVEAGVQWQAISDKIDWKVFGAIIGQALNDSFFSRRPDVVMARMSIDIALGQGAKVPQDLIADAVSATEELVRANPIQREGALMLFNSALDEIVQVLKRPYAPGDDWAMGTTQLAAIIPTLTQVTHWYQNLSTGEAVALWAGAIGVVGAGAFVLQQAFKRNIKYSNVVLVSSANQDLETKTVDERAAETESEDQMPTSDGNSEGERRGKWYWVYDEEPGDTYSFYRPYKLNTGKWVRDPAQKTSNNLGGIDLDPKKLDLQIRRDGNGVPLPVEKQDWSRINIQGFVPVIFSIQPVDMRMLLGLNTEKNNDQPEVGARMEKAKEPEAAGV